jgi:hypothetical protein
VATQTCMTLIHLRRAVPCLGTSLGPGFLAHTVTEEGIRSAMARSAVASMGTG